MSARLLRELGEPESELLILAAASFATHSSPPAVPPGLDWQRFERLASSNLLMPVVLRAIPRGLLPAIMVERWQALLIGSELHYQRAKRAAIQVCAALGGAEIPSALLRGMALAEWVYPEPVLRPMVDVDILVPRNAPPGLTKALAGCGYQPVLRLRSQFVYLVDGIVFELHWRFLTPKRYQAVADWDKWLDSRVQLPGQPALFHLAASDELIALVLHGFIHHELDSLLQYLDIALVAQDPSVDWEYIARWCREAGVSKLFWFVLTLVDSVFRLGLPPRCPAWEAEAHPLDPATADAYLAPLFGADSRWHLLRRKRQQLAMASTFKRKLLQTIRFISVGELRQFCQPRTGIATRPTPMKNPPGS